VLSELEFKLLFYNYVVELNERLKFVIISLAGLTILGTNGLNSADVPLSNKQTNKTNYDWKSRIVF